MSWEHNLSGGAPASHVGGPEFKPQYYKKGKKNLKKRKCPVIVL
jgi:hypothetical protein